MIKLFFKILLLLPLLLIMVLINYSVDPANLFTNGKYEKKIASILLSNRNFSGITNYDERLVQQYYADGVANAKDILVLGSSNTMQISSATFPGRTFFNSSVSGATIEDYFGIYQMYRSHNHIPSMVILGLNAYLLNSNNGQWRWRSIRSYVLKLADVLNLKEYIKYSKYYELTDFKKFLGLVSPEYFRQSCLFILQHRDKSPSMANVVEGDNDIKLSDGSLSYNKNFRSKTIDTIDSEAVEFAKTEPVYSLANFKSLDPMNKRMLEEFVKLLKKDKVKLVFLLPPMHQKSYDIIVSSGKYPMLEESERYYMALGKANSINVYGSFNPAYFRLNSTDFYDGTHPTELALKRVLGQGPR